MAATLVILIGGVVVGALITLVSALRGPQEMAPETVEHWLVARIARHTVLRRAVARADRRIFGGSVLLVAFMVVFASALAFGALFDSLGTGSGFARWDDAVAQWGSDVATPASTDVLQVVTELGSTAVLAAVLTVVGVVDYVRRRRIAVPLFLATVGIGSLLTSNGLKALIMRDRPDVDQLVGWSGSSFPSGHSTAAAACWAAVALVIALEVRPRLRSWVAGLAIGITFLVAGSRALLGVHWLTDVIAGLVVGWTWFLVAAIAFGGRVVRLGQPAVELGAEVDPHPRRHADQAEDRDSAAVDDHMVDAEASR